MKDEGLWYRHSAMNEKTNGGLVLYFDSSAAADSKIIHHSFLFIPLSWFSDNYYQAFRFRAR